MSKSLKIAAWIISVLFHPLNLVLVGSIISILFIPGISKEPMYALGLTVLLLLYIIPLAFVPLCWVYAKITRQEFSEKQQRLTLLFSTSVIYISAAYNLVAQHPFVLLDSYIVASACLMVLSFCITIFWKISLHAIGVGGFLALVIQLSLSAYFFAYLLIPIALIIAGLVMSARLYLHAHTLAQVVCGFIVGVGVVLLCLNIGFYH
ncbi:MAG: phosphatase PAP2 family protein [Bacteroidales bacterium]|jgi:membrane-associated phospholipid phosphatase|nr:phosphatase PAP2 family protein [Bacteroidales bacterium]